MGRYLISPLIQRADCGHFAAGVSIRSGLGQGTHDRVFSFPARFATPRTAHAYALNQGLRWAQAAQAV